MNSIDWLTKLISFDTTSRNSNLELMTAISDWLTKHNIQFTSSYDDANSKANLFATLPAHNGSINGGLILSGHTDVVPVDGQKWDSDPFKAIVKNDRVYGRGASDMKGFIAVVLALVPEFKQLALGQPLHFAFSYDEEVGCLGVPKIIADIERQGIMPAACIVGEPTGMKPVVAHKGINLFQCQVHGQAAHSSLTPLGSNAIEYAAKLISWIRDFSLHLKQGPHDTHYDVAYTTITTNMITGGTATNIIPHYCEFFFEFRNLPSVEADSIIHHIKTYVANELLPQMQRENPVAHITIEAKGSVPAHEISEEAAFTRLIRMITNEPVIRKVSYATEAGLFQQAGIPTLICGPGSIEQAHRANEYIEISQLTQCEDFLMKLVKHISHH